MSVPDPAAGIKEREWTGVRASKWRHLLHLLYLLQPTISLWLAAARLSITSNLHGQAGNMAFSVLPENMVNVTAGATGSYLVKAAMLNLGQSRALPSGAIWAERSTHAPSSKGPKEQGSCLCSETLPWKKLVFWQGLKECVQIVSSPFSASWTDMGKDNSK